MSTRGEPIPPFSAAALISRYAPAVCGTWHCPAEYPAEFLKLGKRPRNPDRCSYLGLTVSHPEPDIYVFGFAYDDHKDGQTDEDLRVLRLSHLRLREYPKGRYELENSAYAGTHRGNKDYLRRAGGAK